MDNFLNKQLRVFFPLIDSSHSVYKSIKVYKIIKKLIVYESFNILCQYVSQ